MPFVEIERVERVEVRVSGINVYEGGASAEDIAEVAKEFAKTGTVANGFTAEITKVTKMPDAIVISAKDAKGHTYYEVR